MLESAVAKARRFARDQRWGKVAAARLLRGRPDRPPELIRDFNPGPVMVVSPHMDDETIGCGGTIIKHRRAGAPVTIVYMTDGARGNPRMERDEKLIEVRKAEARRAAEVLGGPELVFLDLPERELVCDDATAALLRAQIERIAPAVVYVPWILDGHPDHMVTCRATSRALVQLDGRRASAVRVREYEVWSPLTLNCMADVTAEFEDKLRALRQFESQLADFDYVQVARGLGMYRSLFHLHVVEVLQLALELPQRAELLLELRGHVRHAVERQR